MIHHLIRIIPVLALLLLGACSLAPADTSPPLAPSATLYATGQHQNVDLFLNSFDASMRELLQQQGFAIESQQSYNTILSPEQVAAYYTAEMTGRNWNSVPSGAPAGPGETLLAFQKSNALYIVAAIDATQYSGEGVVIYTLKATR